MNRPLGPFWHYTCDHGRNAIGDHGYVVGISTHTPQAARVLVEQGWPAVWADLTWFTDLDVPFRDALGLTSTSIRCDRTRHRYRVTDVFPLRRWLGSQVRRELDPRMVDELERHGLAAHWWIATQPVPVTYDPINTRKDALTYDRTS